MLARYRTDVGRSFALLVALATVMVFGGWWEGIDTEPFQSLSGQDSPLSLGPLGIGVFCGATFWVWYGLSRKLPYWEQELEAEESPRGPVPPFRTTFPPQAQLFEIRRLREATLVMVSVGLLIAAFPLLASPWTPTTSPLAGLGQLSSAWSLPYPTLFFAVLLAVGTLPATAAALLLYPSLHRLEQRVAALSDRPITRRRPAAPADPPEAGPPLRDPAGPFDPWGRRAQALFSEEVRSLWAVLGGFTLGLLGAAGLSAMVTADPGGYAGLVPFPYSLLAWAGWPLALGILVRAFTAARQTSTGLPGPLGADAGATTVTGPIADALASFYRLAHRVLAVQRLSDAVLWAVLFSTIWLAFFLGVIDPFNGFRSYEFPGYASYALFWTSESLLSVFLIAVVAHRFLRLLRIEQVQRQVQRAAEDLDRLEREFWTQF
ncbi:MAG: hypothetical protein L3K08_00530 [Thermoplasmata archaeon]|nr:hypothetical protein [Thermoplasmata archaeon]